MSHAANVYRRGLGWWVLTIIVVAGLAIDAYVHLDLASAYDGVKSSVLTQGDLFRAEASLAIVAGLLVLLYPRRWTVAIAFVVSLAGFALVLIYQYVNVGAIGPLPNMYDPLVYGRKTLSIVAEGVAALASLVLLIGMAQRVGRSRGTSPARAAARASAGRAA